MRETAITRRRMLAGIGLAAGSAGLGSAATAAENAKRTGGRPFGYCLNTATIRGQKLPLVEILRDAYAAGFRGFLSLELFNRRFYRQKPLLVAKEGLAKMRAVAKAARLGNECEAAKGKNNVYTI